ncbi:MAG: TraR/DksA family transcriptional regulator [Lysobacterales bacterium]|nr:MAG: TraR/DksA family transcriptional regulator [Xanthomonadales bacterium]
MLSTKRLQKFKSLLDQRHVALREEIVAGLLASDEQHFIDLAGQVRDLEEESVANLLVDLELTIIDMHIHELLDIEAALQRIQTGAYGICIDCGDQVAPERLRAYPTAKRCQPCQRNYEHNHAGHATPSM